MLTVMRGMNPHIISGNLGWVFVKSWLGCVEVGFIRLWVSHSEPQAVWAALFLGPTR
jgi:hypothetical protein